MSISYTSFFVPTLLPITVTTLFTVPSGVSSLLRGGRIRCTNTTVLAASVTLHNVPLGGSASTTNMFCNAKSIAANDYLDIDIPLMPAGSFVQALSGTASAVNVQMLSGSYFS